MLIDLKWLWFNIKMDYALDVIQGKLYRMISYEIVDEAFAELKQRKIVEKIGYGLLFNHKLILRRRRPLWFDSRDEAQDFVFKLTLVNCRKWFRPSQKPVVVKQSWDVLNKHLAIKYSERERV